MIGKQPLKGDPAVQDEDEVKNAVYEAVDQLFKPAATVGTLLEFMNSLTKEDLLEIAKQHGLKGSRTLKKAELAERLSHAAILNLDRICLLSSKNLQILREVIRDTPCRHKTKPWNFMIYLFERNLVFPIILDGEKVWAIPSNMVERLRAEIEKTTENRLQRNDRIVKLAEGLVEAYGVLPVLKMMDFMKVYIGDAIDFEHVLRTLAENEIAGAIYGCDMEFFYHEALEEPEVLANEIETRADLDYKEYSEPEILRMASKERLFDSPECEACIRCVAEIGKHPMDVAEDLVNDAILSMQMGESASAALGGLLEEVVFENQAQMSQLMNLFMKAYNVAPQWELKGHAPNELYSKDQKALRHLQGMPFAFPGTIVRDNSKVGRNEPCPCGSGKKFKKCCGSN